MNNFLSFIKRNHPLSTNSFKELSDILVVKNCTAKTILSEKGKIPQNFYFLKSGIARAYLINQKGNEYTRHIYFEGNIVGAFVALIKNKAALYTIECLTDCKVIECDYLKLSQLSNKYIDIAILNRKILELLFSVAVNRNIDFLTLNTTKRYLKLKKQIPDIDNLVSQKIIASHLATTTVQLSRIRRSLL